MEPVFINSYEVTPALYLQRLLHPLGQVAARRQRVQRILCAIFLPLCALLFVVFLCVRDWPWAIISFFMMLLWAYFAFFSVRIIAHRQYQLALRGLQTDRWVYTTQFGERILVQQGNTEARFSYDSFVHISQDAQCFYLWQDENFLIYVPKNAFTKGDPSAFGTFIAAHLPSAPAAPQSTGGTL